MKSFDAVWRDRVRDRTPQQWFDLINGVLDKDTRIQVACIVWWDFFASQSQDKDSSILNDLRDSWHSLVAPDPDQVRISLVSLGYPEQRAKMRSEGRGF